MENDLWKLMIVNAKQYLQSANPNGDPEVINAFRISEVLAICTGKLKEDVIIELISSKS